MNLILLNETFARQACELNREAAKEEAPRGCREEEVEGGGGLESERRRKKGPHWMLLLLLLLWMG
jgi:hypothetical protein